MEFRDSGLRFKVWGWRFRVRSELFRILDVWDKSVRFGLVVQGLGFQDLRFRV